VVQVVAQAVILCKQVVQHHLQGKVLLVEHREIQVVEVAAVQQQLGQMAQRVMALMAVQVEQLQLQDHL
jgi:hypothetical protein